MFVRTPAEIVRCFGCSTTTCSQGNLYASAAIIYEIGVVGRVLAPVIVHAMQARDKFLR